MGSRKKRMKICSTHRVGCLLSCSLHPSVCAKLPWCSPEHNHRCCHIWPMKAESWGFTSEKHEEMFKLSGSDLPEMFPPSMSMMTMMSSGDSRLMACHHIPQLDQDQPLGHDRIGGPLGYYLHAVRITLASVHRLMQMPGLPPLFEKKDSATIWAENIEYIRPQKIAIAILLICTNKTSI